MRVFLGFAACLVLAAAGVHAVVDGLVQPGEPGMAVLVRKGGRVVFARGYGLREVGRGERIGVRADFRLASVSKQFTAMAVMLLVRDGKLRYAETLGEVFPEFPEWGRGITVRQLLTHTSGLPDYEELMQGGGWSAERQITDQEALRLMEQKGRPKFAAGSQWAYSNSGYVVLGLAVAKVSGMPFREFLARRVFGPLGMTGSLVYVKGVNTVPERALGHERRGERFVVADQSSTSATQGDGGVYSNVEDLAKWDAGLESHALLSEAEMRPAWTPGRLADGGETRWPEKEDEDNLAPGKPVSYGFGWFLDPVGGRRRMWHFGSTRGFRTAIERFPEERLTVIVLCNRTDLDAAPIAVRVAEEGSGILR